MVGNLVVAFCERGSSHSIEIWAYPDATLNLVVASDGRETSFPCSIFQLLRVSEGRSVVLLNEDGQATLHRSESKVCVHVECRGERWDDCIDASLYDEAIDMTERNLVGISA